MSKPVELVVIGAGARGADAYGSFALRHPDKVRIVGVAEPNEIRRTRFANTHDLDDDRCFATWEELVAAGQLGDAAIVATQDQMHVEPAVAAMEAGYHVLLEKPMAHTLEGCVQLVQASERTGRILQICHVLRYAPFWRKLHEILESGVIGDVVTVEHRENVAYWHMAHSFVRGNWRNKEMSSPMILAKCCHDLDILVWNLPQRVKRLSSVGSLMHYRAESVGPEIPDRCTDNCPIEPTCPFSAIGIYVDYERTFPDARLRLTDAGLSPEAPDFWPFRVITHDVSRAGRLAAIQNGPYGRCVYHCDNDVVDHQTVLMELENGTDVTLVMHGHSNHEHRSMRYDGTKATLRARAVEPGEIEINYHGGKTERIQIDTSGVGHGGGDEGIMADFVRVLRGEIAPLTTARVSLESHLLAFAAEEARLTGAMIVMDSYRAQAEELTRQL
ncbi:MAG: Gfo/Idh/MocA family oxidoreductase [Caldilineaceae bacterium]|nr:Gfo/Idh/MocA family oxidoreductase [Caldilineaceae bacterium]